MTKYLYSGPNNKVSAEVAQKTLQKIYNRDGKVSPQVVVDEAQPENAPLHPAFEWDNEIAANEYRKDQARHVIRHIRIIPAKEEEPKRVWASIRSDETSEREYHPVTEIVKSEDMYARMMTQCFQELVSIKAKYRELWKAGELKPVFDAITQAEEILLA